MDFLIHRGKFRLAAVLALIVGQHNDIGMFIFQEENSGVRFFHIGKYHYTFDLVNKIAAADCPNSLGFEVKQIPDPKLRDLGILVRCDKPITTQPAAVQPKVPIKMK